MKLFNLIFLLLVATLCKMEAQSTAQRLLRAGEIKLRRPYVAGVLNENGSDEQLMIDTMRLDCWTFTEYCLAQALATEASNFVSMVQKLRYRNGQITDYGSRIHYFSEWASQAEANGFVTNITKELGGVKDKRSVNYMSANQAKYQNYTSGGVEAAIKSAEQTISLAPRYYIPKAKVAGLSAQIQSGDIIGVVTSIEGLDISHQGIAVKREGKVYFLHASSEKGKVVLTRETLDTYLSMHKKHSGIVILRPN
jgi:hypothetical protein